MRFNPKQLYWGDNGICLCGAHLGHTARCTGRDLHGTKIEKVSDLNIREFLAAGIGRPACEYRGCPQ